MSRQDPNYSAALDKAEEVWSLAVGLTSSSTSITDIAKQNNTIIELLVSLHKRLARIELAAQKQPESDLLIKTELGNITSKLANLEIGKASSQAVKKVWNNLNKRRLRTIEQIVNPEQQLEKARERRAELLPAEALYSYRLKTENIAQFLGSQGIKAIPGKSFDPKDLNGQIWEISIPHEVTNTAPQAAVTWQTHRRSMTTRYTTYENQTHQDNSGDEEAATLYIITEDEPETISYEDFLLENLEYLILTGDLFTNPPVWDEYDNETSFTNPFATSELQKSVVGEKQNLLEKFTLLEVDNDLPYPTRKPEHLLMSEANSNFNQVPTGSGLSNAAIGPARDQIRTINVPPINQWASTSTRPLGRIPDDKPIVLPPARAESGVFLTLPKNIARWEDAIRSWESSTIIHMAKMNLGNPLSSVSANQLKSQELILEISLGDL
ncbi:hypothetical protein RIF29_31760 [Crotalaria pallida]|uniref:Uncharacterized protein n=1 Tax=Crotalaria pallida TaxID=3830 RepID=A0AAN9EJY0_CROPI